jgi:hypothetical protein
VILSFLTAWRSPLKIPVKGEFLGQKITTTVDSEIARYYVEAYWPGKNENPEWRDKIDAVHRRYSRKLPSRDDLATISKEFSVDFAALFFADRLLNNECNQKLNQTFTQFLTNKSVVDVDTSVYVVLFVPGWDYADRGHLTGADFSLQRKIIHELGVENYLIHLPPTGSVETNAATLAVEISRHSRLAKKIILAGTSSAGPAIHLALSQLLTLQELVAVKAWLNLGGILQGSPLIDYYQLKPQKWFFGMVAQFRGWSKDAIASMGVNPSRKRFQRLQIYSDILIINYIGIPLSGQLSKYAKDNYSVLRSEGPNDGVTLLSDAIAPNSLTVVALGSDHFFANDPRIGAKTVALMHLIFAYLDGGATLRVTGHCEEQPTAPVDFALTGA